jgi:Domain of unknown function (DUF5655)
VPREPWTCPQCGRTLTVRNQEHTCGLYDLEGHFEGKDPIAQLAFDWLCDAFKPNGPYDVLPMKTMVAFARGSNKAFLVTKRSGAEVSFVLSRPLSNPRVTGQTPYGKVKTIYRVRVSSETDLDDELLAWVREAQVR